MAQSKTTAGRMAAEHRWQQQGFAGFPLQLLACSLADLKLKLDFHKGSPELGKLVVVFNLFGVFDGVERGKIPSAESHRELKVQAGGLGR